MDEINSQLEDIQTTLDDHSSSIDATNDQVSQHDETIGTISDGLDQANQDISGLGEKTGQLDFPLTQDSIDRINEVFICGKFTLVSGAYTLVDARIQSNTIMLMSVITNGLITGHTTQYSYVVSAGQIVINSSDGITDTSIIGYVLFIQNN